MNLKISKLKLKWWHWVLLVLVLIVLVDRITADTIDPSEMKDVVVKNGKVVEGASASVANTTSRVLTSNQSQGSPLAPRMVSVPSYDTRLMAASIINEAVDQDAAAIFISLQQTRRNARLQAEIAKLQTQIKESEAAFAEAEAKRKDVDGGKLPPLRSRDMSTVGYDPQTGNSFNTPDVDDGSSKKIRKDSLRLKAVNTQTNEMSFQISDTWYTGVKPGQTIDGFLVGSLDGQLKCVPLTKSDSTIVLCLN
ncbi:hypothetical protein KFE26_20415 [Shewanella sp. M16]|uniref:hypothetical protein n=1 Tax=Shewanella sp. M16 TaxID=2830837 RepID=UPI001BB07466|nr:hypothetical protein [Shewanella sp. M16]MBS0044636.1 hypothetical protein [Shewanella sp. M16]